MKSTTKKKLHKYNWLVGLIVVIAIGVGVFAWASTHKTPVTAKSKATTTPGPVHATAEAVAAVKTLYTDYLPLAASTIARVGNNPALEPALVQSIRASEDEFTPKLYDSILSDYMSEYQSTGKVTKDDVACVSTAESLSSVELASTTAESAVINATLTLKDGTTKLIPVTVDLRRLQASKINC